MNMNRLMSLLPAAGKRLFSAVAKPYPFLIRPAVALDYSRIAFLQKHCFFEFDTWWTIERIAETVQLKAETKDFKFLVATISDPAVSDPNLIGFVEVALNEDADLVYGAHRVGDKLKVSTPGHKDDDAYVPLLAVSPCSVGRGVATALLMEACKTAKEDGAVRIFGECGIENAPLHRVLHKCGFTLVSTDAYAGEGLEYLVGKLL